MIGLIIDRLEDASQRFLYHAGIHRGKLLIFRLCRKFLVELYLSLYAYSDTTRKPEGYLSTMRTETERLRDRIIYPYCLPGVRA